MLPPDVLEQSRTRAATQRDDLVEAGVLAVIRVRNRRTGRRCGIEGSQQRNLVRALLRGEPSQMVEVRAVHREHVVETFEVAPLELTRQTAHFDPAAAPGRARSVIGRLARVIARSA